MHAAEAAKRKIREISQITPSALPESGRYTRITGFDVSPDGNLLGLLYLTWPSDTSFDLHVAIWDVRSHSVVRHTRIGLHALRAPSNPIINDNIIFSSDGKYLIVLGLNKVWILDVSTCAVVRTIDSPSVKFGPPVEILKAGEMTLAVTYEQGQNQFYIALFQIPDTTPITGWHSSAFPQSFSPDGKLAVGPDGEYNRTGVTNLQLMDARTGTKIKTIPVEFGFKDRDPDETGSVTVRFLSNQEILVSPDNMVDHTGHHSGNSLELINIEKDGIVREISPKAFGPTGELAVSPDLSYFAVFSYYINAWAERSEGFWPNFHKPELFAIRKGQRPT
jgi:WD40 repeat protein